MSGLNGYNAMNNFRRTRRALLATLLSLPAFPVLAADTPPKAVSVEITTNLGAITIALDPAKAPNTVANFLHYVRSGFYTPLRPSLRLAWDGLIPWWMSWRCVGIWVNAWEERRRSPGIMRRAS